MSRIIRPTAPDLIIPRRRRMMAPTFYIAGNERFRGAVFPQVGSSLDSATTAWINAVVAAGGTVSSARQTLVNNLIVSLKTDVGGNLFAIGDRLWLHAIENTQSALIDIISLGTATVHGTPTFTADRGYVGNGSSDYLDSNFNPSTAGGHYSLNGASLGIYDRTSRTTGGSIEMGVDEGGADVNTAFIACCFQGVGVPWYEVNATNVQNRLGNTNAQGQFIFNRTDASNTFIRQNGGAGPANASNPADSSTALPNGTIYILARNDGGTANLNTTDQIAAIWIGGKLTSGQADSLAGYINTYMTAIGANVY